MGPTPSSVSLIVDARPRRLTATSWHAGDPEPGDLLETTAGTRYLIAGVRPGRVNPFLLEVLRLAPDEPTPPDATIHHWRWNARNRVPRP